MCLALEEGKLYLGKEKKELMHILMHTLPCSTENGSLRTKPKGNVTWLCRGRFS